jgi:riboflavin synthase
MFTGIVQAQGKVHSITAVGATRRLQIESGGLDLTGVQLGDSIAVSGACLTVTAFDERSFAVDVSTETLAHTTLGDLRAGMTVNLEPALRLSDRLGGHIVSGHVDGVGQVVAREPREGYVFFRLRAPAGLARYIAHKGSICVDGVSLTVNAVDGCEFELLLIPHTLAVTSLGALHAGALVNLEVDLIARYLERLSTAPDATSNLNVESLRAAGFIRE